MAVKPLSSGLSRRSQRGFSLVELMVALTIGLFLMGAVGIIYVNTSNSSRASTLESQMNEDAALALELLQQQIRLAGFSNADNTGARRFSGRAVYGCDLGFAATDANFNALACNGAGTASDAISVRYEATLLNSQDAAGDPGNCAHEGIAEWAAAGEGGIDNMRLADNRYYVAADADGTPALFCQGRTGAGFGDATALIPNIEDMQVQFAVTALPVVDEVIPHQVAGYVNASHDALGDTAANWSRVAAIRVCLIARSATPVPTGDNSLDDVGFYRGCNGEELTSSDRYLRRAYVTTIQLRNARPALPAEWSLGANPWAFLYEE
ncbi:PilW family protein [Hydrogenophaga luteola]|uniref:PilW family protein n=1 Tax=Hydrogenophaga luteola TaxID=1591122 RepID=A0ABV7W706_9BURK